MNIPDIPKDYVSPSERMEPLPSMRFRSFSCFVVGAVVGGIVFAAVLAGLHLFS